MDIKGRIKKFCFKAFIEDPLATVVKGGLILIVPTLCIIFWKWLTTKHSVEFYGLIWLLLSLAYVFLFVHFVYIMFDKVRRIKDPEDVRNVLKKWWRHTREQCPDQMEFTLYFSLIDKKERLRKGSSKKYLREIVIEDKIWRVIR
jgi:hypothetical protein